MTIALSLAMQRGVGLILVGGLVMGGGCGPRVEDSSDGQGGSGGVEMETDDGSAGGDTTGETTATVTTASGSGSGSSGPPSVDPPVDLGLEITNVRHTHQCIDGCESFYFDDTLRFTVWSEQGRFLEIDWTDWTLSSRDLWEGPNIIDSDTIEVVAGEETEIVLFNSVTGFCEMDTWSAPVRVLLRIDGNYVELEGMSSGASGFDC